MNLIHFFLNFINIEIYTVNFENEFDVPNFSAINQVFLPAGCVIKQMTALFFFAIKAGLTDFSLETLEIETFQVQDPYRKNCLLCVHFDSLVSVV